MAKALNGDDIPVNALTIEKRLADIWRENSEEGEDAIARAALWNVIAHTWDSEQHTFATEILGRASVAVPQRTIVIRADPQAETDELSSSISMNCHTISDGRQVYSEEVKIIAAGERVAHVPPLVSSLLLPDMPVAVWWVGDLPSEQPKYVETLLDPADRLIVDSSQFDAADDFALVSRIAEKTFTAPADLSWARIEEWRSATAALFDPPQMRALLRKIRGVRVVSGGGSSLGDRSEAVLYVAWLEAQTGREVRCDFASDGTEPGIASIDIRFDDDSRATVRVDRERNVVLAASDGMSIAIDHVARAGTREVEDLIVRLLKRPEADRVYVKALRVATEVAARMAAV
jgi:glucose-6-phosphate dehydrogenase assembly protein OpcA